MHLPESSTCNGLHEAILRRAFSSLFFKPVQTICTGVMWFDWLPAVNAAMSLLL